MKMSDTGSYRSLLLSAALAILLHLAFTVDSTTAQTTQGPTATAAVTATEANRTKIRYEVVMVHEGISVWAILLMVTILVADACKSYSVVKYTAIVGPLPCMLLAGVVFLLACLPGYNNGNNNQEGFTSLMINATVVAVLAFFAAFSGFRAREYIGDDCKRGFPYGTVSLLCSVGMIPAISGTCYSALNVEEGYQWPGMILGSVCCGEMLILIIWYVTYCMTKKGQDSKASAVA